MSTPLVVIVEVLMLKFRWLLILKVASWARECILLIEVQKARSAIITIGRDAQR